MNNTYDVIIIGAGPAGLNAALYAFKANPTLSLLIIDKTRPWEKPIPCAEGVGRLGFEETLEVKPQWIRQMIDKATFYSPSGIPVTYQDKHNGYIIDRAMMQRDLAEMAQSEGANCIFDQKVISIKKNADKRAVQLENGESLEAKVIIDASGPISLLGRDEKICWKPEDLEPAYFAVLNNVTVAPDTIHIYTGQRIAPGGYAWVFPRGSDCANVGIVIGKGYKKSSNIKSLLDTFLEKNFPNAKVERKFAGSIPCGFQRGPAALPGFLKTGDAASTINPISRAGISEALLSGSLAGKCAAKMLNARNEKEKHKICKEYEKSWHKLRGFRHLKLAKVKDALNAIPDEDYDKAAQTLSTIPQQNITMSKIFALSLGRSPRLVWALRHLM